MILFIIILLFICSFIIYLMTCIGYREIRKKNRKLALEELGIVS
jgi:hypothetical protein